MRVVTNLPRLLIAEDHRVLSDALAGLLRKYYTVVGQVPVLDDLELAIARGRPDVVLLDISFDGQSSLPTLRKLVAELKDPPRFVMLTAYDSNALRRESARCGAHSYLLKAVQVSELCRAIDAAAAGEPYHPADEAEEAIAEEPADDPHRCVTIGGIELRCRQARILLLLSDGVEREAIADEVGISFKGVEWNITRMKESVGVRKSIDLLRWVDEHREALVGAITDPDNTDRQLC